MTYEKLTPNMISWHEKMLNKGDLAKARQRLKESTEILERERENFKRVRAEIAELLGEKSSLVADLIGSYKKGTFAKSECIEIGSEILDLHKLYGISKDKK